MKKENYESVIDIMKKAKVPFTPLDVYKKSNLKMSYRTFLRGIMELLKEKVLNGYKISHGRGRGINWVITYNELVEKEKESQA